MVCNGAHYIARSHPHLRTVAAEPGNEGNLRLYVCSIYNKYLNKINFSENCQGSNPIGHIFVHFPSLIGGIRILVTFIDQRLATNCHSGSFDVRKLFIIGQNVQRPNYYWTNLQSIGGRFTND